MQPSLLPLPMAPTIRWIIRTLLSLPTMRPSTTTCLRNSHQSTPSLRRLNMIQKPLLIKITLCNQQLNATISNSSSIRKIIIRQAIMIVVMGIKLLLWQRCMYRMEWTRWRKYYREGCKIIKQCWRKLSLRSSLLIVTVTNQYRRVNKLSTTTDSWLLIHQPQFPRVIIKGTKMRISM